MSQYLCVKCGLRWHNRPLSGSCSRGGNHKVVVDDGVPKQWRCSKCGLRSGVSRPLAGSCSRGGGHSWRRA